MISLEFVEEMSINIGTEKFEKFIGVKKGFGKIFAFVINSKSFLNYFTKCEIIKENISKYILNNSTIVKYKLIL